MGARQSEEGKGKIKGERSRKNGPQGGASRAAVMGEMAVALDLSI